MHTTGHMPPTESLMGPSGIWTRVTAQAERIPMTLILLALRIGVAMVFLKSGLTKTTEGLTLADQTFDLFEYEYALPLIPFHVAAYIATYAEHILPAMLILGFGGRIAALGLLGMTATIQIFVYPDLWDIHLFWGAALLLVVAHGPGRISADALIALALGRRQSRRTRPIHLSVKQV